MDVGTITILLFAGLLVLLVTGAPIAMVMGGAAVIFTWFLWGPQALMQIASNTFGVMQNFILLAIPLFIFMGMVLEQSGISGALYEVMYRWFGGLRGGLAVGTVIICMIFAAMCGVSGAATVSMGVIALPSMLDRKYSKDIAIGCISAGGALGILIPPSVPFILYGLFSGESIGALFAAGVFPGILLGLMFIFYILIRCYFNPDLGPAIPREQRATWREKIQSLLAVLPPLLLIVIVLGSIFGGVATPTEAAGLGALGAIVCAAINGTLSWRVISGSCFGTMKLGSMVVWIIIGGTAFTSLYTAIGAIEFIKEVVAALPVGPYIILFGMQFVLFILGMLLDPGGIIMICTPVFVPVIKALGFDPTWFGLLFIINMEMAYLTPPFGFNLFYMKAIVPKEISMGDIIRSILPFVGIQGLSLVVCIVFPDIAIWLPQKLLTGG
ncbi:MAG: TRAP transporter large permease subunit [Desulfobacteraceae bacterium]|nr:MAG: TRAP transporter large permease subunit [Desulfobacteraceae bacterium]